MLTSRTNFDEQIKDKQFWIQIGLFLEVHGVLIFSRTLCGKDILKGTIGDTAGDTLGQNKNYMCLG